MFEDCRNIQGQKDVLGDLVGKTKESLSQLSSEKKDTTASDEQHVYEDDQGRSSNSELITELKDAVQELSESVEKINAREMDLQNDMQEQLLDMRETYASKAYNFVWVWSVFLIVVIILQGSDAPDVKIFSLLEFKAHQFHLDNEVIIALISGVTVNIVAVFVVVIKNLFPSDKAEKAKTEKK